MNGTLTVRVDRGIGVITLDRPDRHNAFDDLAIQDLSEAILMMAADTNVRVVILAASGSSFSAGADLHWMKRAATHGHAENLRDARNLARMLRQIAECPKPVVARVQGAAYGGGVGIVAACDIAIAMQDVQFALTEVRLGIIPAAISPYVIAAMGERHARRLMLTAERFTAAQAQRLGLVHDVVPDLQALDLAVDACASALLANGPHAMAACKSLISAVARRPLGDALMDETANRIADIRTTAEAQEGMAAFLEKRKPAWASGT